MPANLELIHRWVRALESGEYEQAHGTLRAVNDFGGPRYCCLGVLCEVGIPGHWVGSAFVPDDNACSMQGKLRESFVEANLELPAERLPSTPLVERASGCVCLVDAVGRQAARRPFIYATEANDQDGYTFEEIAQCVRATWPEAFE